MTGPIYWHSGMLLTPYLLQQHDRYRELQLQWLLQLYAPYYWGVKTLIINELALQSFRFEIERCEVVTREGTVLRFGMDTQSNATIEPYTFEQDLDPNGHPLSVYLAVRRLHAEECNVRTPIGTQRRNDNSNPRRYVITDNECRDLYSEGEHTGVVRRLAYNVQIVFGDHTMETSDAEVLKVGELIRVSDGKGATLSPSYFPPSLTIQSSPILLTLVKQARDLLTAKGRELTFSGRTGGNGIVALRTLDLRDHLIAQTVNRYVPILHDVVEKGVLPPADVYTLLRQIVGELATFSEHISSLGERTEEEGLPPYQHDNAWPCFARAIGLIKILLGELTSSPPGEVVLTADEDYFGAAFIPPQFAMGKNLYFVALRTELSPDQLSTHIQDKWKLASREAMPEIRRYNLRGVPLTPLLALPDELRRRAHYRYLAVDSHSELWRQIETQRDVNAYFPGLPRDTDVRLIAVPAPQELL